MKRVIVLVAGVLLWGGAAGQEKGEEQVYKVLESIAEEYLQSGGEGELEQVTAHFGRLLGRPLEINRAGVRELEELYILTDFQIASIMEYRKQSGDILSATELQLLNGFDKRTVELLTPFIAFGKGNYAPESYFAGKRGRQREGGNANAELIYKGWWKKGEENYLGPDIWQQVKYRYIYGENLQAGFLLEKDAGEKFLTNGIPLGDFASFHLSVERIRAGRGTEVANAVLGDYTIRLGQGLVMWQGFSFSGNSTVQGVFKRGAKVRPYTSSDENGFLRGAAATIGRNMGNGRELNATVFFSLKKVDARIKEGKFTSLPTDGLHNTESTLATRKTLGEIIYGAGVQYCGEKFRIGANWAGYGYDALNGRRVQEYNKYQIYQGQWGNFSIDAVALIGKVKGFAEVAADYGGSMAFLGGVTARWGKWDIAGTIRSYSRSYIAPYAGAYSTISSCSNQTGVSVVAGRSLPKGVHFLGGFEYTFHPWQRYNIPQASHTAKLWGKLEGAGEPVQWNFKMYGSWASYKQQYKTGIKGVLGITPADWIQMKLRGEFVAMCIKDAGFDIGADAILQGKGGRYKLVLHAAYYNCRKWDCRLYMYEWDLPSSFASTLMYGEGVKFYAMIRGRIGRKTDIYIKADDIPKVKMGLKMRFF